jgi:hypothetical protein
MLHISFKALTAYTEQAHKILSTLAWTHGVQLPDQWQNGVADNVGLLAETLKVQLVHRAASLDLTTRIGGDDTQSCLSTCHSAMLP